MKSGKDGTYCSLEYSMYGSISFVGAIATGRLFLLLFRIVAACCSLQVVTENASNPNLLAATVLVVLQIRTIKILLLLDLDIAAHSLHQTECRCDYVDSQRKALAT